MCFWINTVKNSDPSNVKKMFYMIILKGNFGEMDTFWLIGVDKEFRSTKYDSSLRMQDN